jgi:hypothetical protein
MIFRLFTGSYIKITIILLICDKMTALILIRVLI